MRRAAAALLLATLAGCGAGSGSPSGTVEIVAGFYPLAFVAEQVGGPSVTVTNLASPGVEPHDLELTPKQAGDLEDADLAVYVEGFQPAVDDAVPDGKGFDVAAVQPLLDGDPHVWLDPARLSDIAIALGDRLAAIDPDHAPAFRVRARSLADELRRLDYEFATGLATCKRRELVVSHDAFGYLAARYRLEQVGIAGLEPDADPSPARIAEVSRYARQKGVTTVFFETLVSPAVAETVAREAGLRTAVLDPVEGLAPGTSDDYFSVMRRNLAALRTALGCG